MKSPLKIVFAGTPAFAVPSLLALLQSQHRVSAVYTQPDRPAGRGRKLSASPVKMTALEHGIPIFQPETLKTPEAQESLRELAPDVLVVVAYGLILPVAVLNIPTYGCINVHASLLPHWRGAAPIQHALLAGDNVTGVTIMQMEAGLDTGPILTTRATPISAQDTSADLFVRLADLGSLALMDVLNNLEAYPPVAQQAEHASYAPKIDKAAAEIDWYKKASVLDREIRAYYPHPIAFTSLDNETLRIHRATIKPQAAIHPPGTIVKANSAGIEISTGDQHLLLETIQLAGKKAMPVSELLKGHAALFSVGKRLGKP